MALVTQVSDLRTYKLKFSDFDINQAVEQPIPVEPGRTISKRAETVSTGTLGDIITDTRDLEVGSRKDDVTRLKAFVTSGKGAIFASKQVGLDQELSLEFNPRKRLNDAANTAARLANILLQAGSSGGVRLSSNPFGRYIDAGDFVDQIVDLNQIGDLQRTNAPSLAKRGSTIIPDYEVPVEDANGLVRIQTIDLVENIDKDPTSLKSTLNADGTKFDKEGNYYGYAVDTTSGSRKGFGNPLIRDLSVKNKAFDTKPDPVVEVDLSEDENKVPLRKRFLTPDSTDLNLGQPDSDTTILQLRYNSRVARRDESFNFTVPTPYINELGDLSNRSVENNLTDQIDRPESKNTTSPSLNPGFDVLTNNANYTTADTIRTTARNAQRNSSGNFKDRAAYINLGDLSNPEVNNNNNVKLIFDAYTAKYAGQITPIEFIASLENFSDSYSSNWNSTQYIGRGEPVYNFNSTNRAFSFSFKAYSESAGKVRALYRRLNQLASYTNPTYTGTFMAGTFVKLTLGDYLVRTPGFLGSVDFSWETSYPWEVTGTEDVLPGVAVIDIPKLPHVLDVSISFTPIHNFVPEANPNTVNRAFIATNELVTT